MWFPPKPMQGWPHTELHRTLIENPRWIAEAKTNGERTIAVVTDNGVELWSRHGRQHTYDWLGPVRAAIWDLELPMDTVLDGELVCKPKPKAVYTVFDIPTVPGPLYYRRAVLEDAVEACDRLSVTERLIKPTALEDAISAGHEGVVFKDQNSPYQWQAGPDGCKVPYWVKVKPIA